MKRNRDIDLAWFTGLFDGEGCVTVAKSQGGYIARLIIQMCDKSTLDRVQRLFGGNVSKCSPPKSPNHSQAWVWTLGVSGGALELAEAMLYHSVTKWAELVEFVGFGGTREEKRELYKRLRSLKRAHN